MMLFSCIRCATNGAAIPLLMRSCLGAKDMECLSHTITHMGEHLSTQLLIRFKQDICALIKDSHLASNYFFDAVGHHFKHPGNTRWWSVYELYCDLLRHFDEVVHFVNTAIEIGSVGDEGARINRLMETLQSQISRTWLKLEMDVVVLIMKPAVEATYILEGKGPTSLIAFDLLEGIRVGYEVHIDELTFPGLDQAIDECVENLDENNEEMSREWVRGKIKGIIVPAFQYFLSRVYGMLAEDVEIYKCLRFANPIAVKRYRQNFDVGIFKESVKTLKHFDAEELSAIISEIPQYLTLVDDIAPGAVNRNAEMDYAERFWKDNAESLPEMAKFAQYAFTITTSSASAERSFSILKRCFGNGQRLALEDYSMLSCMLQSNRR
jgi:hAT family C-terminal dimerisation region